MSQQGRPSLKELDRKIEALRLAIKARRWQPAEPFSFVDDLQELGAYGESAIEEAVNAAANEVRSQYYQGRRPPERSYKVECHDAELFAFIWDSVFFGSRVYFKFCFVNDDCYVHSLHVDRPHKTRLRR